MPLDPDGLYGKVAQPRRFADTSLGDRDEVLRDNERFWVPSIHNQLSQRAFESVKNVGITTGVDWHLTSTRSLAPAASTNARNPSFPR
jgi:hypothetical protein